MEWQPGGLTWALDNWLYSTYNPYRLRLAPNGKLLREETEANGGQWWSAQGNYGKMWWVEGGGGDGPGKLPAAARSVRSTSRRRSSMAPSTSPTTSRPTSRSRTPRPAASPTCRAVCGA